MRILLVNKYFYRKGGAETYFFALAEGLRALGHEVAFFSMQHPNNESSYGVNTSFPKRIMWGIFPLSRRFRKPPR